MLYNIPIFFLQTCHRLASHELTHVRASPGDPVRRAGRKRGARFESSEALAEQSAVVRSAVELHRCCARVSRAAALVQQHIDRVARASSAGTKSRSSARSLVLLTMLALVSRSARFRDQLQLDDEVNSEIADRYRIRWAAELATVQQSAICQLELPASARHSWSLNERVLRERQANALRTL